MKKVNKKTVKRVSAKKASKKSNWMVWGGLVLAVVLIGGWMMKGEKVGINEVSMSGENSELQNVSIFDWQLKDVASYQNNNNPNKKIWQPMVSSKGYALKNESGAMLTNLADNRGIKIPKLYPATLIQRYTSYNQNAARSNESIERLKNLVVNVSMQAVQAPVAKKDINWQMTPTPRPKPENMKVPTTVELYSKVNKSGKRTLIGKVTKTLDVSYSQSFNFTFDFLDVNPMLVGELDLMRVYITPGDAKAWSNKYGKATLLVKTIGLTAQISVTKLLPPARISGTIGREVISAIDGKDIARVNYTFASDDGTVYNLAYRNVNKEIYMDGARYAPVDLSTMVGKRAMVVGTISSGIDRQLFLATSIRLETESSPVPTSMPISTVMPVSEAATTSDSMPVASGVEFTITGGTEVEASSL